MTRDKNTLPSVVSLLTLDMGKFIYNIYLDEPKTVLKDKNDLKRQGN